MIAVLQNVPSTTAQWEQFAFHHSQSHLDIIQSIAKAGGPRLTEYILYPMDRADIAGWLQRNQQAHIEMDAALGVQSADLQDVDLTKPDQLAAWIEAHFQEHYMVETALRTES